MPNSMMLAFSSRSERLVDQAVDGCLAGVTGGTPHFLTALEDDQRALLRDVKSLDDIFLRVEIDFKETDVLERRILDQRGDDGILRPAGRTPVRVDVDDDRLATLVERIELRLRVMLAGSKNGTGDASLQE